MTDTDDYEPALTDTGGEPEAAEAKPEPSVRASARAEREAIRAAESAGEPEHVRLAGTAQPEEFQPSGPRKMSDVARKMFRELSAKVQAKEVSLEGDDLVPMGTDDPAPAAAAPVSAGAPPRASQTGATAAAVAAPPPVVAPAAAPQIAPLPSLPGLPDKPLPAAPQPSHPPDAALLERERLIAEREAKVAEREKLMPDRDGIIERPASTLVAWLKDVHGLSDPAEVKDALIDLMTELTESELGTKLPQETKTAMESRKALRAVKAYKQQGAREKAAVEAAKVEAVKAEADRKAAAEQERLDGAYVAKIGELIGPAKAQYPYLHDTDITDGLNANAIVYEVLKEQKRLGQPQNLESAVKYADEFYKSKFLADQARIEKVRSRFSPAQPAAPTQAATPAKAATPPGAVPGPTAAAPAKPEVTDPDPADITTPDRRDRRAQGARTLFRKHFKTGAPA